MPAPVATTLKVTLFPTRILWLTGWVVIAGRAVTVIETALDVADDGLAQAKEDVITQVTTSPFAKAAFE